MNYPVLIVEDCAEVAELEAMIVATCQGSPTIALNGADALAQLATETYQLILMDLALPKVDGQAILDILALDPSFQHIPIIVISGDLDRLCPTPQVVATFSKPFDPSQVQCAVKSALRGPKPDGLGSGQKPNEMGSRPVALSG